MDELESRIMLWNFNAYLLYDLMVSGYAYGLKETEEILRLGIEALDRQRYETSTLRHFKLRSKVTTTAVWKERMEQKKIVSDDVVGISGVWNR